ncbi:MAG: hypothetical protein N3A65_00025 [candidate division WOR-3 bacterium]|nr:hypothetical protein [candidate division WOR-3 bacterium]
MRRIKYSCTITIILLMLVELGNSAGLPTTGVDLQIRNKYVWRGAVFNTDPVLWPDLWINWNGVTFYTWGSCDLTGIKQKQMQLTDLAFFLDYTRTIDPITPTIGFALYTYPGSAYGSAFPTTGELYIKIGGDLKFVQGLLNLNYDVVEAKGLYISSSLSKGFSFGPLDLTFTLSGGFANGKHNAYYYGLDKTCLTDFGATLKLSYLPPGDLSKFLAITGDINFVSIVDSELKDYMQTYADVQNVHGGIGLSVVYSFGGD